MKKNILFCVLSLVVVMFLIAGCQEPGALPPGPGSLEEDTSTPIGQVFKAVASDQPCAPLTTTNLAPPNVFSVGSTEAKLEEGVAKISLKIKDSFVWQTLNLRKYDESKKGTENEIGWHASQWAQELHPKAIAKPGLLWLKDKEYSFPTFRIKESEFFECKEGDKKVKAVVFAAYTPSGNKKWMVHVVKLLEAPKVSCTDGVKNQDETDVDCGGVCVAQAKLCELTQNCGGDNKNCRTGLECDETTKTCKVAEVLPEAPEELKELEEKKPADCVPACANGQTCDKTKTPPVCVVNVVVPSKEPVVPSCTANQVKKGTKKCGLDAKGVSAIYKCAATPSVLNACLVGQGCIDVAGAECVVVTTTACTKGVCDGAKVTGCSNDGKLAQASTDCGPGAACDAGLGACKGSLA